MSKLMKKHLAICSLLLIGIIFLITLIAIYKVCVPEEIIGEERIVNIPYGMPLKKIAHLLETEGIIKDPFAFEILVRIKKLHPKAGEYTLSSSMNMLAVLKILTQGNYINSSFTIPPGYNIYQIANLLEKKGFAKRERFLELAKDEEFIKSLGIPVKSLEGYLSPNTYFLSKGVSCPEIIKMVLLQEKSAFTDEDRTQAKRIGLSLHQVLTLASIIEKEAKLSEEKRLVSSVFHNRLKKGQNLESCPTVIYALMPNFDGNLKSEDLHIQSPYNTYNRIGLPPGPICNPSIFSIKSALYPENTDYLFFVSKKDGSHKFSTTIEEHRFYVSIYQHQ